PQTAMPTPRRRAAWLKIFVVRCSLPCDPPAGGHFMQWRDDTTFPSRSDASGQASSSPPGAWPHHFLPAFSATTSVRPRCWPCTACPFIRKQTDFVSSDECPKFGRDPPQVRSKAGAERGARIEPLSTTA